MVGNDKEKESLVESSLTGFIPFVCRYKNMRKQPTIEDLEKLLDDPEEHPIEILPDGSIKVDRRRKGKGFILSKELKKLRVNGSY